MKNEFGKRLAVLSVSTITILGSTAVSPALSGIKSAFPQISDGWIQMILTLPILCIIPSCILCRYAICKIGEKKVLLLGIIIYLIGGLGSGCMPGFYSLLVMRGVLGIGCGLITPMAQNLISSHFFGEVKVRMTSYSASASYLMGIIASFTVGKLVGIQWRLAFLIYFIALVVFILNFIYLPDRVTEVSAEQKKVGFEEKKHKKINVPAMFTILAMFGVNGAFYTFSASISLFMRQEKIGDDTSSGIVVASFMICGFIVGLLVSWIRKYLKGYTMALGCLMMGVGYFILHYSSYMTVLMIAAALVGGSYSILYSGIFTKVREQARSKEETTTLVTITTAFMFLGQAVSQYILRGIEFLIGQSGYRCRFEILSIALFIGMIGCILGNFKLQRRKEYDIGL